MAIYAITGKPRHGKTLFLMRSVVDMLKANQRVFSNVKLNLGVGALRKFSEDIVGDISSKKDLANENKILFYWRNVHEWNHMNKGVIIADEGTRYFNARQWAQLSEDTEIKLQQHGKEDLDIWLTTQHYSRLDVSLRLLVEKFFIVETVLGNPDNKKPFLGIKRFQITALELEDLEDWYRNKKFPDQMQMQIDAQVIHNWFRKKYAIIYDTRQAVGRSEMMPLVHKKRVCEICGKEEIKHL